MQWYEVESCLNGLDLKNRTGWEQTRGISYMIAQVNSRKKLNPTDIMKFHWDGDSVTAITNDDVERLKQKSNETLKLLNNG
jgi:hypothetical protein